MSKIAVARSSFLAAIGLTAFKLVVGLTTGSLGIISEAIHSGLDLVAAFITLVAVRVADKEPDREHQFGHGKFENLSALMETMLLVITCVWIIYEAIHRLSTGRLEIEVNLWSFVVIVVAIIVDFSRSRALSRAARKFHSQALEADALHFSSDIFSSLVVLVGLVCYTLDIKIADSIASIIVAMIVLGVSWRLGQRSVSVLVDRAPEGVTQKIEQLLHSYADVEKVENIRVRSAGPDIIIEMTIESNPMLSFEASHRLSDRIEQNIQDAIPRSHVHVHMEPSGHDSSGHVQETSLGA
ncbi:MAG TPA: cation diffusion facilitator family transporter [Bacteroidota bacterium]|nr:cation diffusion facilitator family transporter [Bacteroidota bacterium]